MFNLVANRSERRSTIVATDLAFREWVSVLAGEKLTTALLDRLRHHAHILTTKASPTAPPHVGAASAEDSLSDHLGTPTVDPPTA